MKTEISKEDFYKVVGLLTLAKEHNRTLKTIEKALAEILEAEPSSGLSDYYGHVSDAVYNDTPAADLLDLIDVTVQD